MLIDYTYFTGLLSVGLNPDTNASPTTVKAERGKLESYIDAYEPEYLIRLLGWDMYKEFASYIDSGLDDDDKWNRLKQALTVPYSPVACYVYFKYISEVGFNVTDTGVVASADEDALSPSVLQRRAWNDMVRYNRRIVCMFQEGEYDGVKTESGLLQTINEMGI